MPQQATGYTNIDFDWASRRIFKAHSLHITTCADDPTLYVVPPAHSKVGEVKKGMAPSEVEKACRACQYQIGGTEKRRLSTSMPKGVFHHENKKVVDLVRTLPPGQQCWVRYAYTDSNDWDDESGALQALWDEYEPGNVTTETLKKLQGIAYLCLQNHKHLKTNKKVLYKPKHIRKRLGVPEGNWYRDWAPRWQAMVNILELFDAKALIAVLEDRRTEILAAS